MLFKGLQSLATGPRIIPGLFGMNSFLPNLSLDEEDSTNEEDLSGSGNMLNFSNFLTFIFYLNLEKKKCE